MVPQPQHHEHANQTQHRLIEEERNEVRGGGRSRTSVLDDSVLALNGDAPGQVGRRPVQLLVHEVAPSTDDLGQKYGWNDDVAPAPEVELVVARYPDHGQKAGEEPAVDAEPAVGGQHDLAEMVFVVAPLVDDVICPPAEKGGHCHHDQGVHDHVGPFAALACQSHCQPCAGDDGGDVGDSVPADLERADGKSDRIGCEVDHGRVSLSPGSRPRRHSYTGRDTEARRPAVRRARRPQLRHPVGSR